jgi:zeta-carotene desaturase
LSDLPQNVGIVGGGIAGLSAACALADSGFQVTVFERRPFVGGRASSYEHPATGETVDNCQHVLFGNCTNLLDFYRRIGVADKVRWFERLTLIEPGGRRSEIGPSLLPAPLHTTLSLLKAKALTFSDKLSIARAMASFVGSLPPDGPMSFAEWLDRHRQTPRAIERFWRPVLVSALNEELDRISVHYAAKVVRDFFLKSAQAGTMGVPTVPLSDLYRVPRRACAVEDQCRSDRS